MKLRFLIIKHAFPWVIAYAVLTGNSDLICWAIIELPKMVTLESVSIQEQEK